MTHKTRVSPPYVLARAHTLSLVRSRSSSPPPPLPPPLICISTCSGSAPRVAITVFFLCIFGLDCSVINLARATSSTDLTAQWLRRDSYIFLSHFVPFYTPPSGTRQTPTTVPHLLVPLHCTIPGALHLPTPPLPLHAALHPRATCLIWCLHCNNQRSFSP